MYHPKNVILSEASQLLGTRSRRTPKNIACRYYPYLFNLRLSPPLASPGLCFEGAGLQPNVTYFVANHPFFLVGGYINTTLSMERRGSNGHGRKPQVRGLTMDQALKARYISFALARYTGLSALDFFAGHSKCAPSKPPMGRTFAYFDTELPAAACSMMEATASGRET